ncbi:MAG: hypothetical protein P8179_03270 [Candidatus Thiodiazotropha sp.]
MLFLDKVQINTPPCGTGLNLKRSVGQREGCVCGGAGQGSLLPSMCPRHLCIPARRTIARYSKALQRRHVPPQACHSRCRVIHPVGDHHHRSYFL